MPIRKDINSAYSDMIKHETFQKSFHEWAHSQSRTKNTDLLNGSIDSYIQYSLDNQRNIAMNHILNQGMHSIIFQRTQNMIDEIDDALFCCKTPYERMTLLALIIIGRDLTEYVYFTKDQHSWGDRPHGIDGLCIEPQASFGDHIVDFLITYEVYNQTLHKKSNAQKHFPPTVFKEKKRIIINCDPSTLNNEQLIRSFQSFGYHYYGLSIENITQNLFLTIYEILTGIIHQTREQIHHDSI